MKKYFYRLLAKYLKLYIRPEDTCDFFEPGKGELSQHFQTQPGQAPVDYIILDGQVHYDRDVQNLLSRVHAQCTPTTRVILVYYSALWRPLLLTATLLGLRTKTVEQNWVAHEDMANLLLLADFEIVRVDNKILCPVYIPILSNVINRYIAPLPFFRMLTMVNILMARPVFPNVSAELPSVSVVVPARNEAGNIEQIIRRTPQMGSNDELIFIEGHSTDDTWAVICEMSEKYKGERNIIISRQDGKGKGDAVRKGFSMATKDVLMILDADMTVPPEDLPKFYRAIQEKKGEFINGSRLVYPMEKQAMRFLNMLGNKFFALAFSFIVGQRFKDTLCGTKVISRKNYLRLASHRSYFGEFDPFGDFDLLFGAARLGLKIVEVPIHYKDRTYGSTNISRWKHGAILLSMVVYSARKLRFL